MQVLPKLQDDNHPLELDVPELLKEVSRRGGFWCTCALQVQAFSLRKDLFESELKATV